MTLKTALLIIGSVTLLAGLIVGIILVSQQQLLSKKAAVSGGISTFQFTPSSSTVSIGQDLTISGVLNSGGAQISGYQIVASFTYTGTSPITISQITNALPATFTSCPQANADTSVAGTVTLNVLCEAPSFYTTTGDETVFTFNLHGDSAGSVTFNFNQLFSKVTQTPSNVDILNFPVSATYTVSATGITPTPTPTTATPTPTTDPTVPTPTTASGTTPTATPIPLSGTNACGGACTSNDNCTSDLYCYQGFCRKAACPADNSCTCSAVTATPTTSSTTSTTELAQSGSATLLLLGGAGLLLIVVSGLLLL